MGEQKGYLEKNEFDDLMTKDNLGHEYRISFAVLVQTWEKTVDYLLWKNYNNYYVIGYWAGDESKDSGRT